MLILAKYDETVRASYSASEHDVILLSGKKKVNKFSGKALTQPDFYECQYFRYYDIIITKQATQSLITSTDTLCHYAKVKITAVDETSDTDFEKASNDK